MADVPIEFTIPDAHVTKIQNALDYLDPGGGSYVQRYKRKIRDWTTEYYKRYQQQSLTEPAHENLATQLVAAEAIIEIPDIITDGF